MKRITLRRTIVIDKSTVQEVHVLIHATTCSTSLLTQ